VRTGSTRTRPYFVLGKTIEDDTPSRQFLLIKVYVQSDEAVVTFDHRNTDGDQLKLGILGLGLDLGNFVNFPVAGS